MGGKVGLDWEKERRTAKVFFCRTAEVFVLYLLFGLVFMGPSFKYIQARCQKDGKVIWNNDGSCT